jgi:hypothetical protein
MNPLANKPSRDNSKNRSTCDTAADCEAGADVSTDAASADP